MHEQLQLIRNPDIRYVLLRNSETVGWIQPGIVGLAGYPSRVDAYFAADGAASTLRDWSLGREVVLPVPFPRPLAPDERVRVDDRVIGRLVRRSRARPSVPRALDSKSPFRRTPGSP